MADDVAEELEEPPEAMGEELDEPPEPATTQEPPAPCPYLWPPAVAALYERKGVLAKGMFGDVHRAWDRAGERLVAVKRLSGSGEGGFLKTSSFDLDREAMTLGACRGHPSVVELVATHAGHPRRPDGDLFLITEYAGPINLRSYMLQRRDERRPFAEAEVRHAMRQLLAGAEHVHGAGVLHRDMVPENVVVDQTEDGRMVYRICGFGMAAAWKAGSDVDDLGVAALAAASPYLAPEVILGARDYDGGIDMWALGCIMAELLAGGGAPFFAADESGNAFEKVQHVAGTRGIVDWPGMQRIVGRRDAARLRETDAARNDGCLRKVFPKKVLSEDGFEVLSGLLQTNPDKRLTAKAALQKPWFTRPRPRLRFGFRGCCFAP